MKIKKFKNQLHLVLVSLVLMMLFASSACKSPTSPNGEGEADIVILNEYGESLNIFMNNNFVCTLDFKSTFEIDNVSFGFHELEAHSIDSDRIVDTITFDVEEKTDYEWEIDDPADINITNDSNETVNIYMDGVFLFKLLDEENRWIIDVPFGEHFLQALRVSDLSVLGSMTLNISENIDYEWKIK